MEKDIFPGRPGSIREYYTLEEVRGIAAKLNMDLKTFLSMGFLQPSWDSSNDDLVFYWAKKDGYDRNRQYVAIPTSRDRVATTDDTLKDVCSGKSALAGVVMVGVYQSSGGNLEFHIGVGGADVIIADAAVVTATYTLLSSYHSIQWPDDQFVKWSAAAGATQYVDCVFYDVVEYDDIT